MTDSYYDIRLEDDLRRAKNTIQEIMAGRWRRPIRESGEEIDTRWGHRDYRHYAMEPAEKQREKAVQRLASHLSERNDNGFIRKTGGLLVANGENRDHVNARVREAMRIHGGLGADEKTVRWKEKCSWENQKKVDPQTYQNKANRYNAVFKQDAGVFKKDEVVQILGAALKVDGGPNDYEVLCQREDRSIKAITEEHASAIDVYENCELKVAKGEQLRAKHDSIHARDSLSADYQSGNRDPDHHLVEFMEGEVHRLSELNKEDNDLQLGRKEATGSRGGFGYGYTYEPDEIPDCDLGRLILEDEELLNHPKVQEYIDKYPGVVETPDGRVIGEKPDKKKEAKSKNDRDGKQPEKRQKNNNKQASKPERDFSHLDCSDRYRHFLSPANYTPSPQKKQRSQEQEEKEREM